MPIGQSKAIFLTETTGNQNNQIPKQENSVTEIKGHQENKGKAVN